MKTQPLEHSGSFREAGQEMYSLIAELYPLCRSITGAGFRQTMELLRRHIPLTVHEVPSGTQAFDWVVPLEWNIRDAYIRDPRGRKVVDFHECNLHVVNYSTPVRTVLSLEDLKGHLHTLPDHPEWIPYRTSYYKESWGFCLADRTLQMLDAGDYEVVIDATLKPGSLTYGELLLPGEEEDEILVSCHACHPSLANDNLSGVSLATMLARHLGSVPHRYSYRFLFLPGTIGAITWLSLNQGGVHRIKHGLVITGVGDSGTITYKKSRSGNADIDRAACHVLKHSRQPYDILDFHPYGYDERQYCSPGFNLPVGRLSRTPYGKYQEYHTSADNLDFVKPEALGDSFMTLQEILQLLEHNGTFLNLNPHCEPQLGKRGLYDSIGDNELAMLWVLNLSDGTHSLLDIAESSDLRFAAVQDAAEALRKHGLLKRIGETRDPSPRGRGVEVL